MTGKKYFGTDGIRGRAGEHPITPEFMLRLGRAIGRVLGDGHHPTVLIGKDTRVSGYMLESALEAGLVAAEADVRLLGPMPTPAVAFLTRALDASAGIVISASHNPYHDNGIKLFSALGEKLDDAVELAIERELEAHPDPRVPARIGKAARVDDAVQRYMTFCFAAAPGLDLRGRRIVLDCAHGATYHIAPRVFADLGADVVAIGAQPDGFNINAGCGATDLRLLQATVRERGADLGIAFDGDGDRVQMVDAQGAVSDGDDLLFLLVRDRLAAGTLRGPVVGTLMTNYGIERAIVDLGVEFVRADVGDRYVLQALKQRGGILGGEASGHLLCLDKVSTGDGIIAALLVLEVLQRTGQTLTAARAGLQRAAQKTVNVPVAGGAALIASAAVQQALGQAQRTMSGRGRVVLRPSGTEPLVRVTVEGADAEEIGALATTLADAVRSASQPTAP
jgi:phosphoglucosamine mutase